jgi:hypothetical protein
LPARRLARLGATPEFHHGLLGHDRRQRVLTSEPRRPTQMSILTDLVLELLGSGIGPSTDRGLVTTFTAGSVGFVSLSVWLLMISPDPLSQPPWGIGVYVGSILVGAGGCLVSVLHLRRNTSDRALGVVCLAANAAAVAIPTIWILTR